MGDEIGSDAVADVNEIYEIRQRADGSGEYEVFDKKWNVVASGWAIRTREQAEAWIAREVEQREAEAAAARAAEAALSTSDVPQSSAAIKKVAARRYWEEDDAGDASYNSFGYVTTDGTGGFLAGWEAGDLCGEQTFGDAEEAAEWIEHAFDDPEGLEAGTYS
jgi:hypothetical protein